MIIKTIELLTEGMFVVSFVLINVEGHISKTVMHMIIMKPTACIRTKMLTNFESILTMMFIPLIVIDFIGARAM